MDEHTIKCNTETRRNKQQIKNIKPIVPQNPKEKQGTSQVWSPILLRRETSYGLGCTTTDNFDTRNQYFPICKRNQTYNTKGYRIIPCFTQLN